MIFGREFRDLVSILRNCKWTTTFSQVNIGRFEFQRIRGYGSVLRSFVFDIGVRRMCAIGENRTDAKIKGKEFRTDSSRDTQCDIVVVVVIIVQVILLFSLNIAGFVIHPIVIEFLGPE